MSSNIEGLTRFTESFSSDNRNLIKAELAELRESLSKVPTRIREAVGSEETEGWWVPISFYNKVNGNNRNYPKELWENITNNQRDQFVGSYMLTDHPVGDSDGNPSDACGVWLDMKLGAPERDGAGVVYGLLVPATRKGEDLADILKKGGKVGTSSSGFGKLMKDGVTVDPNTYVIERLADWVLNPSQGTFFAYDESDSSIEDRSMRESEESPLEERSNYIASIRDVAERYIKCHENPTTDEVVDYVLDTLYETPFSRETVERIVKDYKLDESKNNIYLNITKEKVVKDSKITKLEEKKFRKDMESFLEDASKIKDPQERLEEFKEIRSYLEDGACPDLREQVEQKIAESEEFIKTALKEKMEFQEELEIESPKDLKEKLSKISEDVQILEKESQDWKQISEALQTKYSETKAELAKRASVKYVEYLKAKNARLGESLKTITKKAEVAIKELTEALKKAQASSAANERKAQELTEANNAAKASIDKLTEQVADLEKKYTEAHEENEVLKENTSRQKDVISKLTSLSVTQRSKIEESSVKTDKLETLNKQKSSKIRSLDSELCQATRKIREQKAQNAPSRQPNALESYFESLYREYGDEVVPYKRAILGKKTLAEAKNYFYRTVLQNLNESQEINDMRLPESLSIDVEDRVDVLGEENFKKTSMIDRKPKGWY